MNEKIKLNIMYFCKYLILFVSGVIAYLPLHYVRNDKYPFMILTGGLIFVVTAMSNNWFHFESYGKELIWEGILITILVSTIEVWIGFADTMLIKLDMWTYESRPFAVFNDKTCLLAFSVWNIYILCAIIMADGLDYYCIKKYDKDNPPQYSFLRDKIFVLPKRK